MELNIGKTLTYEGVYNSSTVYQKNSIVEGQYGATYVSLVNNPGDLDDATQWKNLFPGIDTSNLSDDIEESSKGMTSKSGYELYSKAMSQIEDCKKIEDKLSNFDYFSVRQALEDNDESSIPDLGDIISDNYNLYTDTIEFIVVDDKTITLSDSSTRRGLILVSNKVMSETDLYKLSRDIQTNFVDTSNGKWRFLSSNNINLTGTETDLYTYLEDIRVELGYSNWADHIHELRTILNQLDTSISDTEYLNLLSNSEKGFFVFDLVATNIGAKYLTGRTYNVDFEDMADDMFKHPDTFRDKYLAGDVITTDYNPNVSTSSTQTNQFKKMNWTIFDRNKRPTRSSNMPIEGNVASYMNTLTDENANNYYTFNLKNDVISLAGQSAVTCGYVLKGCMMCIDENMPAGWYCFLFKGVPKTVDDIYHDYRDIGRRFKNKYFCFYVDSTKQSYFVKGNKIAIDGYLAGPVAFRVFIPQLKQVGTSSDYVTLYQSSETFDVQTVAQYTADPTSSTNGWIKVCSTLAECPAGTVYLGHSYDFESGIDSNVSGYGVVGNMTSCFIWNNDCYISPTRFWLNSDSDEDYRWLYEWQTWIKTNYPEAYKHNILYSIMGSDKKGFLSRLPKDVRNSLVPVLHSYWSAHAFTNGVDNDEENFLGQVDPVNEPNSYNNCKLVNYHFYSKVWTPRSSQTTNCKSLIATDTTSGNFKTLALTDKFKYWWGTYRWENEQYDLFRKTPFAYYNRGSSSPYWDFIKQIYPSFDKLINYYYPSTTEVCCSYMEHCIFSDLTRTTGNVDNDSVCRFVQMLGGEGYRIICSSTQYTEGTVTAAQYNSIIPMLYVGAKSKVTSIDFRDISNEIKNDISTDDRLNDSYEFSYETKGSVVSSRGTGFSTLTTQATVVDNRVKKVLRDGVESSEVVVSLLDKNFASNIQYCASDIPEARLSTFNYFREPCIFMLPYFYGSRKPTLNNYYYFKFHNTPMVNDAYFNNTIKNKWFVFKCSQTIPDYYGFVCSSRPETFDVTVDGVVHNCIRMIIYVQPSIKYLCENTSIMLNRTTMCSEAIDYTTGEQFNFQTTGTVSPSSYIAGEIKMFDSEEDLLTEFPTATLIGKAIDPSTGSDNIDYGFGKFGNLNMQVDMSAWITNPLRYWLNSDSDVPGKWFEKYEEDFPLLSQYVTVPSDASYLRSPGFLSRLPKSVRDSLVPTKYTEFVCSVFDTKDDYMGQMDFVNNPAGINTRTIQKFYCYDKITVENNWSFSDSKFTRWYLDKNLGGDTVNRSANWYIKLPWFWGDEEYENTHFNAIYEEGIDNVTDSLPTNSLVINAAYTEARDYSIQVNWHDITDKYRLLGRTYSYSRLGYYVVPSLFVRGREIQCTGAFSQVSARSEYRRATGPNRADSSFSPGNSSTYIAHPIYNIGKDGKDLPNLTNVFVKEMVPDVDFEWTNRTTDSKWPAHLGYIDYFKKFNFEQAVDAEEETSDETTE